MTLRDLAEAADAIYHYDADDKAIIRRLAETDKDGLRLALEADELIQQYLKWGW